MPKHLVIRIPAQIRLPLDDESIKEIADRIREDDDREDEVITNEEVKTYLASYASEDFDSFYQDWSHLVEFDLGEPATATEE